jgi:hypothetical protein
MPIPEDLEQIEKSIKLLQIEWEKFFGGVEKKPPTDLKGKVEALIRRHANAEIRNNTERFRYQNLTARYNTFNEMWGKRLRALEEGRPLGVHGQRAQVLPPAPVARAERAERAAARAAAPGEVRIQDPERDSEAMRSLFDRFLEERQKTGESGSVKFEGFRKLIAQQANRILTEKGGQAVSFRLETKDGKVSLKAKALK